MMDLKISANNVIVTGAGGFIGNHAVNILHESGFSVKAIVRRRHEYKWPEGVTDHVIGDLHKMTEENPAWDGVGTVVHLAGRAHIMRETAQDPKAAFYRANVAATLALARTAAARGVKRFVFISSIGAAEVEEKNTNRVWTEALAWKRLPYQTSKWEAEQKLRELAAQCSMELVILRPPMVYGARAKGNLELLIKALRRGWPLPLSNVNNKRGFIFVDNLVSAIECAIRHPDAAGKTFAVSDGEDISTPELIQRLAHAAKLKPPRLFPFPTSLMMLAAIIVGKRRQAESLLGSLPVDIEPITNILGWKPPFTMEEGLILTSTQK